ncbi:MAG: universal stress protein [Proteobacteria bacterium]|nr:universal stress protein [Pseudomonadota bacterium]
MQKKIVIAVDDSIYSKHSVKYAANVSKVIPDISYTLFNVQDSISQYIIDEAKKNMQIQNELNRIIKKNEAASHRILVKYKDFMINSGIDANRIEIGSQPKLQCAAKDILDFGQKHPYDAIVVGRRGFSRIQKTFMGSVTSNILEHCTAVPVWLTDGTITSSKIMVAMDGSLSSMRAIDHLAFIVSNSDTADITLYYVIPKMKMIGAKNTGKNKNDIDKIIEKSSRHNIEHVFLKAKTLLEKAGLRENQIHFKFSSRFLNPGKAIINESEKGNYGTIVVGRSGISKSIFMGSVSRYVINHISNRAVWVVS